MADQEEHDAPMDGGVAYGPIATDDASRETRLELARVIWAVVLIDLTAVGLGFLASQYVPGAQWVGVLLAGWVTASFLVLVGGNLGIEWLVRRRKRRRGAESPRSSR